MSVGNLYRFYASKGEIAAAGAEYCLHEKAEVVEFAISDSTGQLQTRGSFT